MSKYSRSFIALEQDSPDYTMLGKKALGKTIIECNQGKGKVLMSVSGLRPEVMYKAYIVSADEKESSGVHIGNILVDVKGNGELKFETNADDVKGTGINLKDFNISCLMLDKANGPITPLVGYKNEKMLWKSGYTDLSAKKEDKPEPKTDIGKAKAEPITQREDAVSVKLPLEETPKSEILSEPQEAVSSSEKEQTIGKHEEKSEVPADKNKGLNSFEHEKKESVSEINKMGLKKSISRENRQILLKSLSENRQEESMNIQSVPVLDDIAQEEKKEEDVFSEYDKEDTGDVIGFTVSSENEKFPYELEFEMPDENLHSAFKKMAEKFTKDLKELEDFTNLDEKSVINRFEGPTNISAAEKIDIFENIIEKNTKIEPFKDILEYEKWVGITLNDLNTFPDKIKVLLNNSVVVSYYNKYKHLALGKNVNTNRYFLGVPGGFYVENEKRMKDSGFHLFKCCDYGNVYEGKEGYWIMIINKD